jgi:hypothetical protein
MAHVIMIFHQTPVPPKVIVVEDEMLLRMRAVDIVEDEGFTPIEAVNADEALAFLNPARISSYCLRTFKCPAAWMASGWLTPSMSGGRPSRSSLVSGKLTPTEAEKPVHSRFFLESRWR